MNIGDNTVMGRIAGLASGLESGDTPIAKGNTIVYGRKSSMVCVLASHPVAPGLNLSSGVILLTKMLSLSTVYCFESGWC